MSGSGSSCEVEGDDLIVSDRQTLKIRDDFGGHVPKLEDQPWPAFPADLMSIAIVTATQCAGVVLMFEKMFESRMFFVDKLIAMGAPHRAMRPASRDRCRSQPAARRADEFARHPRRDGYAARRGLRGRHVSTINNADQIERGYERIDQRLNALGAKITRIPARGS